MYCKRFSLLHRLIPFIFILLEIHERDIFGKSTSAGVLVLLHDFNAVVISSPEWYLVYFMTPYFIFLRDTVSYLALLGLHCAVCLSPSTLPLSGVEVAISVFFGGRILMELKQIYDAREKKKSSGKRSGHFLLKKLSLYFR